MDEDDRPAAELRYGSTLTSGESLRPGSAAGAPLPSTARKSGPTKIEDLADTRSSKTRESIGRGVANIVTEFFGGMGGCATIGQTMIKLRSGARTRLSTFLAGAFPMTLCIAFGPIVSDIPMAALVAVLVRSMRLCRTLLGPDSGAVRHSGVRHSSARRA